MRNFYQAETNAAQLVEFVMGKVRGLSATYATTSSSAAAPNGPPSAQTVDGQQQQIQQGSKRPQ